MKKRILILILLALSACLYSQPNPYSVTKYVKTTRDTIILSRYTFDVKLTIEVLGGTGDTVFLKTQKFDTTFNSEYFNCVTSFSANYRGTKFILKSNRDSVLVKYYIGEINHNQLFDTKINFIKFINNDSDTSGIFRCTKDSITIPALNWIGVTAFTKDSVMFITPVRTLTVNQIFTVPQGSFREYYFDVATYGNKIYYYKQNRNYTLNTTGN
jgi:hypothetical protein